MIGKSILIALVVLVIGCSFVSCVGEPWTITIHTFSQNNEVEYVAMSRTGASNCNLYQNNTSYYELCGDSSIDTWNCEDQNCSVNCAKTVSHPTGINGEFYSTCGNYDDLYASWPAGSWALTETYSGYPDRLNCSDQYLLFLQAQNTQQCATNKVVCDTAYKIYDCTETFNCASCTMLSQTLPLACGNETFGGSRVNQGYCRTTQGQPAAPVQGPTLAPTQAPTLAPTPLTAPVEDSCDSLGVSVCENAFAACKQVSPECKVCYPVYYVCLTTVNEACWTTAEQNLCKSLCQEADFKCGSAATTNISMVLISLIVFLSTLLFF